uniref:ABC2_membrane domain-containing protein n=1 Tax=Ascaris lumbricoides TaxID=6252 RepID=A0A0M3HMW9_ASCLU
MMWFRREFIVLKYKVQCEMCLKNDYEWVMGWVEVPKRSHKLHLIVDLFKSFNCALIADWGYNCSQYVLIYGTELSDATPLCTLNDFLPMGSDYRKPAMPIVWYCRVLEFSIPTTAIQLLLCLIALFAGLNRRNNLFVCGYSFLCVTIFFSSVFLSTMLALRVTGSLEKAIRVILLHIPYEETFCAFISPILECRILRRNSTDLIEHQCGPRAENVGAVECKRWLSEFVRKPYWLVALILEYGIIIVSGIAISIRGCIIAHLRKQTRSNRPETPTQQQTTNCVESEKLFTASSTTHDGNGIMLATTKIS